MKNTISTMKTSSGKIKEIMTLQKKRSVKWKTQQQKQPNWSIERKKDRKNKLANGMMTTLQQKTEF